MLYIENMMATDPIKNVNSSKCLLTFYKLFVSDRKRDAFKFLAALCIS